MHYKKIGASLLILLTILSCSTKKNTFVSRNYHNLTAHYNVFFNGNESFKAGEKKVIEVNKDNYTEILMVFPSSKKENIATVTSEMDIAIEKGSKLIQKHSITVKPKNKNYAKKHRNRKEFNNWVDNGYLLVAKSLYYKQSFDECISACNTIIRDYSETESRYEATIWMARALIELKQYDQAQSVLDGYDVTTGAPKHLLPLFYATSADLKIRQEKYDEATTYMKSALEKSRKKYFRIRYQYILAQLYHKTGNLKEATLAYENVQKLNPSYQIAFNAKINRGSILLAGANSAEIKKELYKLLKNKKNADFNDRIYYALGKVSLSENNLDEAQKNFQKSIASTTDNMPQKTNSYIEIGNIHYLKDRFTDASLCYDSAMAIISQDAKDYHTISEKQKGLSNLAKEMSIVNYEDSVQQLAQMSPKEQEMFVENMINDLKVAAAAKEKAKQEALQRSAGGEFYNEFDQSSIAGNPSTTGKWFFYNPTIVAQGKSEFDRRWGSRKLEDNWRRSNKEVVAMEPSDEGFPGDPDSNFASETKGVNTKKEKRDSTSNSSNDNGEKILSKEEYLKNIPNTPEELATSNENHEKALFNGSRVFANQLNDLPNAIKHINMLIERYPNSQYRLEYLSILHNNYKRNQSEEGMERTKQILVSQYPNAEYTQYLLNPNYLKELEQRKLIADSSYQECYDAYLTNAFEISIDEAQKALAKYPNNHLADKFIFVKALSNAKIGESELFKNDLTTIVTNYKESECAPLAQRFLDELEKGKTPVKVVDRTINTNDSTATAQDKKQLNTSLFSYPDSTQSLVVVVASKNINKLIYNIADYNFSQFILKDFDVTTQKWKDKTIIKIESFESESDAMSYFYSLREQEKIFEESKVQIFVITKGNLTLLSTQLTTNEYTKFFNKNYLKRND